MPLQIAVVEEVVLVLVEKVVLLELEVVTVLLLLLLLWPLLLAEDKVDVLEAVLPVDVLEVVMDNDVLPITPTLIVLSPGERFPGVNVDSALLVIMIVVLGIITLLLINVFCSDMLGKEFVENEPNTTDVVDSEGVAADRDVVGREIDVAGKIFVEIEKELVEREFAAKVGELVGIEMLS